MQCLSWDGVNFFLSYYYKINHWSGHKDQIWRIASQAGWVRYTGYQCFAKWHGTRNCFVYLKILESWNPNTEREQGLCPFHFLWVSSWTKKLVFNFSVYLNHLKCFANESLSRDWIKRLYHKDIMCQSNASLCSRLLCSNFNLRLGFSFSMYACNSSIKHGFFYAPEGVNSSGS